MHATTTFDELIDVLEDGRLGFARGAERLERDGYASLAAMFRDLSDERARFADELRALDGHDGGTAARATPSRVAHRGWQLLRDAVVGGDPEGVLGVAEQNEEHARSVYELALSEGDLPAPAREVVRRQHAALKAAYDRVRVARGARRV